jgi:hypothetical protein
MTESKNTSAVTDLDREEIPAAVAAASPTEIDRLHARLAEVEAENLRLTLLLNTPEVTDFAKGVVLETLHQRERWGSEHDEGKTPFDWFWLVGYLAQKAASSHLAGDRSKALHHTVSTAAALNNWHAAILGFTGMRPGIGPGNAVFDTVRNAD